MKKIYVHALALVLALSGCFVDTVIAGREGHMVYTMSNAVTGNAVLAFAQRGNSLVPAGTFLTEGNGSGSGLGNQNGIVMKGHVLLVVNAGSNDISALRVHPNGLQLTDRVNSGGTMPISVTMNQEGIVYVLNAGGTGNITGFMLNHHGKLTLIPESTRPLSGPAAGPAQIAFNPEGGTLVVTEKTANMIDIYEVDDDGLAQGPMSHPSKGTEPFGFAFDKRGTLIVSEAVTGALSSYTLDDSSLTLVSESVSDFQHAACWVVVSKNNKFAYTANSGSNNISSYRIMRDGTIVLHEAIAAQDAGTPLDLAVSRNGKFLYVLNNVTNSIEVFHINKKDGSLSSVTSVTGLPVGANGLVAR